MVIFLPFVCQGNCENNAVEASSTTLPSHRHSFHSPLRDSGQHSRPVSRDPTFSTPPPHDVTVGGSVGGTRASTRDPSASGVTPLPPQSSLILPPPIPPKLFTRTTRQYIRTSPTDLTAAAISPKPDRAASEVSSGGDGGDSPPLPPHRLPYPDRLKMCRDQPDYLPAVYPSSSLGSQEVFDNADRIFLTAVFVNVFLCLELQANRIMLAQLWTEEDSASLSSIRYSSTDRPSPLQLQQFASSAHSRLPASRHRGHRDPLGRSHPPSSSGAPPDTVDFTQLQARLTPMSEGTAGFGGLQHLPTSFCDVDLVPPSVVHSDRSPELPPRSNRECLLPPPAPPPPVSGGRQSQRTSLSLAASVDPSVTPPLPPRVSHYALSSSQEDWLPPVPPKSQGRGPPLSPPPPPRS
ncbi:unnamed protein product [Schistocephalus solidus]|uniref:Uncharacterized protein n=1 Tax=Schistocephalus solidus TaxID=70667 RepID=A0A183SPA1_SCHSO|nr:unnamed protein product [Schistocephalus solidus]